MSCQKYIPFGAPIITHDLEEITGYSLFIINFDCEFWLKDGKLPTIQIKNSQLFNGREYLENSKSEIVNLTLTSVDYEMFLEHYEVAYFKVHKVYYFVGQKISSLSSSKMGGSKRKGRKRRE